MVNTATKRYQWATTPTGAQLTLGNGVANATLTGLLPIVSSQQIGILITFAGSTTNPPTNGANFRVIWSDPTGTYLAEESLETNGTAGTGTSIVSGSAAASVVQKTLSICEWGPVKQPFVLFRPCCGTHFKLACYSNGAPDAGEVITADIRFQGL